MPTYMQMQGSSTAYDMQPYLLRVRGFWLRKATTNPSFKPRTEPVAFASQPALWRISNTSCHTAQALQTSDLPTATSLLSRNSHTVFICASNLPAR